MRYKIKHSMRKRGILALSFYMTVRKRLIRVWFFDLAMINFIARLSLKKPKQQAGDTKEYTASFNRAILWHGTGMYQYSNGKKVSVLASIIEHGGIKPFQDVFPFNNVKDYKDGELISVSLARHRMYARVYCDMHQYKGPT